MAEGPRHDIDGSDVNERLADAQEDPFIAIVVGEALHDLTETAVAWGDVRTVAWGDTLDTYATSIAGLVGLDSAVALVAEWLTDIAGDLALERL